MVRAKRLDHDCRKLSREFTRVLADVGIAYEADVGRGLEVLAEIGDTWAEENPKLALEPPKAQGVIELADSAGGRARVAPAYQGWIRRRGIGDPVPDLGAVREVVAP